MSVTRERIIELGEELILTKGYNGFSYQDISTVLGIKNAAIHYYFPNKENLGVSILKTNIQRFEEMVENMQNRQFDGYSQLESFMKLYLKSNRENKICIIGSLGTDLNTLPEPINKELTKMVELILAWMKNILSEGKNNGIFKFKLTPYNQALHILGLLVSGLQLSRLLKKNDFKVIYQSILDEITPE